MKRRLTRLTSRLLIVGVTLAMLPVVMGGAPAAHAYSPPRINASVDSGYRHLENGYWYTTYTVHVTGSNFTPGGNVDVDITPVDQYGTPDPTTYDVYPARPDGPVVCHFDPWRGLGPCMGPGDIDGYTKVTVMCDFWTIPIVYSTQVVAQDWATTIRSNTVTVRMC